MTDAQLQAKFVDQVTLILGASGAKEASKIAVGLKDAADVRELVTRLPRP